MLKLRFSGNFRLLSIFKQNLNKTIFRSNSINSVMEKPQVLLLSSSKLHGFEFLEYAQDEITNFLQKKGVSTVLFIPYALKNHDSYLEKVSKPLNKWGFQVEGIHKDDPIQAVERAEAVFIGGGNTFLLLKTLYEKKLVPLLRKRVIEDGMPYMGSSAGTNVAAMTINNTNDMPIVYPPSFDALQLIPFNINPHYLDPDAKSTHKGETREERILQYHELEECQRVLGLREGSMLLIEGQTAILKGLNACRLFIKDQPPKEFEPNADLSFLLVPPKN